MSDGEHSFGFGLGSGSVGLIAGIGEQLANHIIYEAVIVDHRDQCHLRYSATV